MTDMTDYQKMIAGGVGGAALGGVANSIFGDYNDPVDAANKYYDQIPDTLKQYYQPYVDQGLESMGLYNDQLAQLLKDPTFMMNQIGAGYKQSPGYQKNVQDATQGAMNVSAASGQAGSPQAQMALANQISQMSAQDYNNYVNQGLRQYNTGLQGEQYMTGLGYNASSSLADNLASMLMSQANMAYSGAQGQNAGNASMMGGIGQAAGMALPFFF